MQKLKVKGEVRNSKVIGLHFGHDEWIKNRPNEDFFAFDKKTKTFVLADGVGLFQDIEYKGKYPKISGSALLAKKFCLAVKNFFRNNPGESLKNGFAFANKESGKVNKYRSKYSTIPEAKNLFAATAALVRIKNSILEWGYIGDASVAVVSKEGQLKLWKYTHRHRFPWPKNSGKYNVKTWTFFARTLVRNAIGQDDKLLGYGVVTGEKETERYFETGKYKLKKGDVAILFSDGFEPYFEHKKFLKLLVSWKNEKDCARKIKDFIDARTEVLRKIVKGKKLDGSLPYEELKKKARQILKDKFSESKWADEKTIIVIKP